MKRKTVCEITNHGEDFGYGRDVAYCGSEHLYGGNDFTGAVNAIISAEAERASWTTTQKEAINEQ